MKVQVGGFVAVAPAITADGEALRRRATLRPRTRALVVLHEGEDVNGRLVQSVSRLRSEPVIARAEAGEALPDPATFRLAVLVGSSSFADALASGQLASEVEWIRQADAAGTAVFGSGTVPARWRTPSAARSTSRRSPTAAGRSSKRRCRTGSRLVRGSPGSTI